MVGQLIGLGLAVASQHKAFATNGCKLDFRRLEIGLEVVKGRFL